MNIIEWKISEILESKGLGLTLAGNPAIIDSPYGKAVHFNGIDDGMFLEVNPIIGVNNFTIEAVFHPDSGGSFEQRFLHLGMDKEDRLLLETRTTESNQWYFDAYIATGASSSPLVDKEKLHPADKWHHVAFVIDDGNLTSYVNGIKELTNKTVLTPMQSGRTSIGVRQNKINWFKGSIYNIRITHAALAPEQFTK